MLVNQPAGMVTANVFLDTEFSCVGRWTGAATNCSSGSGSEKHIVRFQVHLIKANKHTELTSGANFSIFLNFQRLASLS